MNIQRDISLQSLNTLALPAQARFYCQVDVDEDIPEAIAFVKQNQLPFMVLGEGSNIVLTDNFPGLVLHCKTYGITPVSISQNNQPNSVIIDVAAGENWHNLVRYTLSQGWYGLENLALIPGSVGASPIQNIGAYGLEVAQRIVSVTGWSIDSQCWKTLSNAECQFGYRDSIFKQALKDRFIVSSVRFELSTIADPVVTYAPLLERLGTVAEINPVLVADTVEAIRREKLPDPQQLPNAGSFFKNPVIAESHYQRLKQMYPAMPGFLQADGIKVPAAWLIDNAGWKGHREGAVGIHANQALVLVNFACATGADVLSLAQRVQQDVLQRYDVALELEPRVYP